MTTRELPGAAEIAHERRVMVDAARRALARRDRNAVPETVWLLVAADALTPPPPLVCARCLGPADAPEDAWPSDEPVCSSCADDDAHAREQQRQAHGYAAGRDVKETR